jgi:hypothetical protein
LFLDLLIYWKNLLEEKSMIIDNNFLNFIFTEYDETLTKKLHLDPLGLQIIWSYFGQKIFHNKTTSVALDIRNYNVNLFNHYIIYQIIQENEGLSLNKIIRNDISVKEKIEKILIVLENLLIWSWYSNRNNWSDQQKTGLLGSFKALSLWEGKESYKINFREKVEKIEILKNQKILGISGRYKGPFKAMRFFKEYEENSYKESSEIFEEVEKLIERNIYFQKLYKSVINFLKKAQEYQIIEIKKNDEIVKNFELCFKDTKISSEITKDFWKKYLGLMEKEASIIYEVIDLSKNENPKEIFQKAQKKYNSKIFQDINQIEPQLTYLSLLFDYLIFKSGNNINDLDEKHIEILKDFKWDFDIKNSSVLARVKELEKIKNYETLIKYHEEIMKQRAQMSWIELKDDGTIKTNIIKNIDSDIEELLSNGLNNDWINSYYIPSIRNIKRGLEYETL